MQKQSRLMQGFVGVLFVLVLVGCGVPNLGTVPLNLGSNSSSASVPTTGRIRGNSNAPVTIVEYSDFQ
jgi:protein-disulfide isomerase